MNDCNCLFHKTHTILPLFCPDRFGAKIRFLTCSVDVSLQVSAASCPLICRAFPFGSAWRLEVSWWKDSKSWSNRSVKNWSSELQSGNDSRVRSWCGNDSVRRGRFLMKVGLWLVQQKEHWVGTDFQRHWLQFFESFLRPQGCVHPGWRKCCAGSEDSNGTPQKTSP